MQEFSDVTICRSSMSLTRVIALSRVTAYVVLACFLRMQGACCCAAHSPATAAAAAPQIGCDCHGGSHGSCCAEEGHGYHDDSQGIKTPSRPQGGCHLCVIAHLHYVLTPQLAPLNFLANCLSDVPILAAPASSGIRGCAFVDSTAPPPATLLACGSLLRV